MAVYSPLIQQFITDFQQKRWAAQPFERALDIALLHPEQLIPFINAVVTELPKGGTFLDVVLNFLPLSDFPEIVQYALGQYARNKQQENAQNEAAASIIAYSTLQCLPSVHPHLPTIFESGVNEDNYYSEWPWREANTEALRSSRPCLGTHGLATNQKCGHGSRFWKPRHPILMDFAHRNVEGVPLTLDRACTTGRLVMNCGRAPGGDLSAEMLSSGLRPRLFDNEARPAWMRTTFHPT